MASLRQKEHKHYRLDASKIRRAKRVLMAETETETIEKALDFVLSEHEANRLAWEAHDAFLRSGLRIEDVFGALDG